MWEGQILLAMPLAHTRSPGKGAVRVYCHLQEEQALVRLAKANAGLPSHLPQRSAPEGPSQGLAVMCWTPAIPQRRRGSAFPIRSHVQAWQPLLLLAMPGLSPWLGFSHLDGSHFWRQTGRRLTRAALQAGCDPSALTKASFFPRLGQARGAQSCWTWPLLLSRWRHKLWLLHPLQRAQVYKTAELAKFLLKPVLFVMKAKEIC